MSREEMTPEQKADIDSLDYEDMLRLLRFAPAGHPYFISGDKVSVYFSEQMEERLKQGANHTAASKSIGWDE